MPTISCSIIKPVIHAPVRTRYHTSAQAEERAGGDSPRSKKSRHFPFRTQRTSSTYSMPKASALLQNIADIILRPVEYMEDLEEFICDGIDCDIPAHPKRTVAPLRELGMNA